MIVYLSFKYVNFLLCTSLEKEEAVIKPLKLKIYSDKCYLFTVKRFFNIV